MIPPDHDGMDDYGFLVLISCCFVLFILGLGAIAVHAAFFGG